VGVADHISIKREIYTSKGGKGIFFKKKSVEKLLDGGKVLVLAGFESTGEKPTYIGGFKISEKGCRSLK